MQLTKEVLGLEDCRQDLRNDASQGDSLVSEIARNNNQICA